MIGVMIALGMIGLFTGAIAISETSYHNTIAETQGQAAIDTQQDELDLAVDEFDYQKEQDLQGEREGIIAQANAAAMAIDPLIQQQKEALDLVEYYNNFAGEVTRERDDELSMYDNSAARTKGSQKVALALSGAKIDTGTAQAVREETNRSIETDRGNLKGQYDFNINNYLTDASNYQEKYDLLGGQINTYDTLLTDIYNANSDWMTSENVDEYGGEYGDWLTERAGK